MPLAGTQYISARPNTRPLVLALLVSVAIHVCLFVVLVLLNVAATIHAMAKQNALTQMQRLQNLQKLRKPPQETPLLFVETDPSQIVEAPKNPKYYSAQNSRAANPDAQTDTSVPKIDGSQTHVPKAENVTQPKAMPLMPAPPPKPTPPEEPAEARPKSGPKPGDLAMAKPVPKPEEARTEKEEAPVIAHQRPRTVAEARQQQGLAGEKLKQDGGVQRQRVVSSFDAVGTAFGDYDARIIAAVQRRWYDLLDDPAISRDRAGRVVVEFRLNYDGRITDLKVVESDVSDLLSYVCMAAIKDPSPYDRWPTEMRRVMEGDSRLVRFTFFYE